MQSELNQKDQEKNQMKSSYDQSLVILKDSLINSDLKRKSEISILMKTMLELKVSREI